MTHLHVSSARLAHSSPLSLLLWKRARKKGDRNTYAEHRALARNATSANAVDRDGADGRSGGGGDGGGGEGGIGGGDGFDDGG